jgi:ABC-2 type transport system permease protein
MTASTAMSRGSLSPGDWRRTLKSFLTAAWLGWQIESNWTDPFLFAIYSVVKPLAGAAILVVMYGVVSGGAFEAPVFAYIFLGNAFYIYVGSVMTGVSWAVVMDREQYKVLKYMYVAPINIPVYLVGRAVARFLTGTISVAITLLAGVIFFHLPLSPAEVNLPMFLAALALGVAMLAMLGLILAGVTLITANQVWFVGDATAAALFLFSGAIFPIDLLPAWLRPLGFAMPLTYWLELLRRSLIGRVAEAFPTLAGFSDLQLFGILAGLTIAFSGLAFLVFRLCDHRARERGLIDWSTNY